MEPWSFLVKFPPHLLVEDVASYPCLGLMKEGVTVNVEVWDGEFHSEEENSEVWVQLRGLKPQWCTWDTLARFTSSFGLLVDIDWQGMFLNYYEVVRVKLQCRDPSLIPAKWLFEVKKKYHKILLQVEPPVVIDVDSTDGPDGPGHDVSSDAAKTTDDMDTEANSSTTQKLPEKSTGDSFSKNGNNQISSGKKAASSPLMDSPGSCLSSLPIHLEPARRELMSWLSSDNPDEENATSF
jgi:hypothetical protein